MIEYATLDDLRQFGTEILAEERASIVKRAERRSPAGTTFLSHSSKDAEFLPGVIRLLEGHGTTVYVDKKDENLPPYTSRETAQVLRGRIAECRKFVLLASKNSKDSRWMPWELGLSDGIKKVAGTAVLPGVDSATDTKWAEQEYLGLYDRIVWGDLQGREKKVWMVLNQVANTATELSEWLRE